MNERKCPICDKETKDLHDMVVHHLIKHIDEGTAIETLLKKAIFSIINSGGEERKNSLFNNMMVVTAKMITDIEEARGKKEIAS